MVTWVGKGLLMVGPFGDWLKYSYDSAIHVVEEVRLARLLSNATLPARPDRA